MGKERLLILLGTLIALIFFYVGLNKWLESKSESAPPPVVVKPTPPQSVQPISPPQEEKAKEEPKVEEKKPTPPPESQKPKEDLIAQKIQEEKTKEARKEVAKQEKQAEKPKGEVREYVIQIGAFSSKENADRALEKAKSMGYRGEIVNEDNFYKVRVRVKTDDPKKILAKLKATFGGAIIKQ
jgi:DedD protein